MTKKIRIGILKETKTPPDRRVVLTPDNVLEAMRHFPEADFVVQKSTLRCFTDNEYLEKGITMADDMSVCDVLMGVKEVHIPELIPDKQYHFFSHTHKKQSYNRPLLQTLVAKKITMVDHECLTYENGTRVVAFGRWAGIVGAYNAMLGWGLRTGDYQLKRAVECFDRSEMMEELKHVTLAKNLKILITGKGRVGMGAMETLSGLKLKMVTAKEFLTQQFNEPVICQIDADEYVEHKDGGWKDFPYFFKHPDEFVSTFTPFSKVTDIWIPCHFWDQNSPAFLKPADYQAPDFRIQLIADVSCDLIDPIPSTLHSSSIKEPFYGYNPITQKECNAFDKNNVTVMAVDNLPGELPRDASGEFGARFIEEVIPAIVRGDDKGIIMRGTICSDGKLTERYAYLEEFLNGK